MQIRLPTPLRSYSQDKGIVEADGATLAELLQDLDRRYPGIRFRIVDEQDHIRTHINIFVNQQVASDLAVPISASDSVRIIAAISGG